MSDALLDSAAVRSLFGPSYQGVQTLAELLVQEGVKRGLIGPKESGRLWTRHLTNCAALERYLPSAGTVLDIGSGAGLPGLVLAMMRPDLHFELVDAMRRRTQWLTEMVARLGLGDNTTVTWSRVEALPGQGQFDAVVSRAVGDLATLVPWSTPLLCPGGVFLALKGQAAGEELRRFLARSTGQDLVDLEVLAVQVLPELETTYVVRGTKPGLNVSGVAHN